MLNLDQTISEWRRQMLAAGIKAPVPLEELELHLREEIERHTKSGLNEAEAFQAAVDKIGQPQMLQKEFDKVEKSRTPVRAIKLVTGWVAASCALCVSVGLWNIDWDFFAFYPHWSLKTILAMLGMLGALVAMWFLTKASRDKANRVISLLLCVILAGIAVALLRADVGSGANFLGYSTYVPYWYRAIRTLPMCVPGIFWVWWTWGHYAQKHNVAHRNQPIHSD